MAAGGIGRLFGRFAASLVDAVEDFAHVFDLFEEVGGNVNRTFLRGGQRQAIARARVDFHDLAGELVLLLEDEAREVS